MSLTPYCSPAKSLDYYQLLRFARFNCANNHENISEEIKATLAAMNSLPSINAPVRPLLPLLYRNAVKTGLFEQLDQEPQDFLKQNAMILVARELSNQQWLKNTFKLFSDQNLSVILLKGAAFARNLYLQDAPRPGVDLDILVKINDFDKACELLETTMSPVILAEDRLATHATLFERVFASKKHTSPTVEIHRGLTNPHIFTINEDDLWNASVPHPAYESELVRILSPEDTLLHLATHAFRDLDFCTHNVLDTHEIIHQQNVNTTLLVNRATVWGATRVLYYILYNTRAIMNTSIEPQLLLLLKPNDLFNHINKIILQDYSLQDYSKSIRYRLVQLISQMSFPDSLASALRFQAQYMNIRARDILSQ